MGERNMSIVFSSGISSLTEHNSSFDSGVLRVCYTGRNRNNSFISKETFERCMPSIYNCPIVCRYDREENSIGSHDMELVTGSDGGMRIVNVTHPVGIVPESANHWWEEIEDDSGLHEYLCVDALIWKRQEAYKKIKEDGITNESMEISVKEGEMIDGVYVIKRFEFTAFCLLGSARPCYESALLEFFSHSDFKAQFAEMMQELKETFTLVQLSKEVVINSQNNSEGEEEVLKRKIALLAEYGLSVNELDYKLEDFTVDELRVKFEEIKKSEPQGTESFALAEQFREELVVALGAETVETCFGTMARYCYVDYDNEVMEVYCYDTKDWKLYSFPYSMNGDNVTVDFTRKKRKKFSIVDFDEGEQPAAFAAVFAEVTEKFTENDTQWSQKYQTASNTISSLESELGTLRQFRADTENAIARSERDEVLAQFEDLVGVEAFENLREHCIEYTADVLEEKCYAIRGRNGSVAKFSMQEPKAPKLKIEKTGIPAEPYGGVFAEYGINPAKQHN
jgi:hypothetical protein